MNPPKIVYHIWV